MSLFHALAGILKAPSTDCSFTASTIPNLNRFAVEPTNSFCGARLRDDGTWSSGTSSSSGGFGAADGTWQGGCPLTGYETRWTHVSGDAPNDSISGADGVWSAGNITKSVGYFITGSTILSGSFTMECRDAASLNVLFVDPFNMTCEVDPRN